MKKLIFFAFLFILFSFFAGMYFLQNRGPNQSYGNRYAGQEFKSVSWHRWNNKLDLKSYGFGKPSSKNAMILDFSQNDLKYNDSVLGIITQTGEYFDDGIKEWKKTYIIHNKKRHKVKYKFHGSHNFNYKQGKISLKIKSSDYINGVKQFSLISGFIEATFINIFLAEQEKALDLIGPDPGTIILANINGKVEDFWFTQDMSDDYIKNEFGLTDFRMFEVSDNWTRNSGPHYSKLDRYHYYLDSDNLIEDTTAFRKYEAFRNKIDSVNPGEELPQIDADYMGRYLANLYFFYHGHHVMGDNNKLLYNFINDTVYPIARNEGVYRRIPNVLKFDEDLFSNFEKISPTSTLYYKAVCNDKIRAIRDLELYKLSKRQSEMIAQLDSLSSLYYSYHKFYNETFMNVRFKIKKIRDVISYNSGIIEKYINNGEVAIAYNVKQNKLTIVTDYKPTLKVVIGQNNGVHFIKPLSFFMEKDELKNEINENEIQLTTPITKTDIQIVNTITGDTIPSKNIIFNHF